MKLLSVIVPIYNAEKYLYQCLNSLVKQSYRSIEIILIDDGSTDQSSAICDDFASKYPYVKCIHKQNEGVMKARNIGLDMASGDYIALCDSDDALDLDAYEIMIHALEETESDVVACSHIDEYKDFVEKKNNTDIPAPQIFNSKQMALISVLRKSKPNLDGGYVWNKIFRRTVIDSVHFRDDVAITDDLQFTWDALKQCNSACYVDLPLYHYRYLFSAATKSSNITKQLKALNAWENIREDIRSLGIEDAIIADWACSYIVWNIKICEKMIFMDKPDVSTYHLVKNNIEQHKEYIPNLSFRHRLLAYAILKSWKSYRFCGRGAFYLKHIYTSNVIKCF